MLVKKGLKYDHNIAMRKVKLLNEVNDKMTYIVKILSTVKRPELKTIKIITIKNCKSYKTVNDKKKQCLKCFTNIAHK